MSTETMKAPRIKSDFLFTWLFKHLKPSSSIKLCEIPDSLDLKNSIKSLKKFWSIEKRKQNPSFARALSYLFWPEFLYCTFLFVVSNAQKVYIAVMIKELVDNLNDSPETSIRSSLLAASIVFSAIFMSISKSNSDFRVLLLSSRIRSLTTLMLSKKLLKIHKSAINEGNILNIFGSDFELFESIMYITLLIGTPLIILNACLILYYTFGSSGLIGIGISVGHIPIIFIMSLISGKFRKQCNHFGDIRIKLLSNLVEGIKIFKIYAWELAFLDRILKIRGQEFNARLKLGINNALTMGIALGGVGLTIFVTFYVHLKWIKEPMTIGEKYMLISIYLSNHLQIVHMNTIAIFVTILLKNIFKRITSVMLLPEYKKTKNKVNEKYSVSLKCAYFSHKNQNKDGSLTTEDNLTKDSTGKHALRNLNFSLRKGKLLIVVGSVGSGKSVLLQAIQQELYLNDGVMMVNGTISYASEVPWIISGTIQENILMGSELNSTKFHKVLSNCCLLEDIDQLLNKDQTWIGERGITISGGQKARINLARALYRDFDILLLDDPLSAVDSKVCNHIFNNCILDCIESGKTVILVTHQLQYLDQADKILVLENGISMFFGSPEKLKNQREIVDQIKRKEQNFFSEEGENFNLDTGSGKGEEDEEMTEKLKFSTIWRFLFSGFGNSFFIFFAIGMIICIQVILQETLYWSTHRSDLDETSDDFFLNGLGYWVATFYITVTVSILFLNYFYIRCNNKLHNDSIARIATVPSVYFDKNPSGRIISRFTKDVSNCDGSLHFYLIDTGNVVGMVFGSIIILFIIAPLVLVSLPVYFTLQFFILYKVSSKVSKLRKIESLSKAPILSLISSMLEGIITIRCQKLQAKFESEMKNKVKQYFRSNITYQGYLRFCQLYSELAGLIIISVNLIILIQNKDLLTISLIAYSLAASINVVTTSSLASKDLLELSSCFMSAQHLLDYQYLAVEKLDSDKKLKITNGKIQFKDLSLRYQPHLPIILKNLSITINPGEKVGIVGRTGSGKSSIFNVLCRLTEPESGTIFIDEQDYLGFGIHDLRKQISVIPQSAVLFSTTLKDNIDPFNAFTEDCIKKVLCLVGLDKLVQNGIEVKIGTGGAKLSSGEKQLVCIARAILLNNKIVLLDEATSNIDEKTDRLIQRIIKEQFLNSTLIVIAHRILTAADSDKIAVMENGSCVEFGKPIDLFDDQASVFRNFAKNAGLGRPHFLDNN